MLAQCPAAKLVKQQQKEAEAELEETGKRILETTLFVCGGAAGGVDR